MTDRSEAVKRWRKNTKSRIVESMGGKCQICGYAKCEASLALHHIDPTQKELSFNKIRATPQKWDTIVGELRKCILLCHNCHSELHAGVTELPAVYQKFDESFVSYKLREKEKDSCPVCGKEKHKHYKFCSTSCSSKFRVRVDWESVNLSELLEQKSLAEIARMLDVSSSSVHKRAKKLGLR